MSAVLATQGDGVRPMFEEDIAAVMAIETEVYEFPWTGGIFNDCLQVGYSCWVYQQDSEVVAYAVMSIAAHEGHILTIVVQPRKQGCGLGTSLLQFLLNIGRRQRIEKMLLEVRPSNAVALALYEKAGFCRIGRRPNYYPAPHGREDAIVMALDMEPIN
ncbi:MAG: ribosomal protein S18-alanine N-acetyltransferase [Gammaproteobacteria bacterium]